jgi:hypothetical protein
VLKLILTTLITIQTTSQPLAAKYKQESAHGNQHKHLCIWQAGTAAKQWSAGHFR